MSKKRSYAGLCARNLDYCLSVYGNNPTAIASHLGKTLARVQRAIGLYNKNLRVILYTSELHPKKVDNG